MLISTFLWWLKVDFYLFTSRGAATDSTREAEEFIWLSTWIWSSIVPHATKEGKVIALRSMRRLQLKSSWDFYLEKWLFGYQDSQSRRRIPTAAELEMKTWQSFHHTMVALTMEQWGRWLPPRPPFPTHTRWRSTINGSLWTLQTTTTFLSPSLLWSWKH